MEAAKEIDLRWAAIMEWRRSIPAFRLALEEAFECRALLNRESAQQFAYESLQVLVDIVRNEKALPPPPSPGVTRRNQDVNRRKCSQTETRSKPPTPN